MYVFEYIKTDSNDGDFLRYFAIKSPNLQENFAIIFAICDTGKNRVLRYRFEGVSYHTISDVWGT